MKVQLLNMTIWYNFYLKRVIFSKSFHKFVNSPEFLLLQADTIARIARMCESVDGSHDLRRLQRFATSVYSESVGSLMYLHEQERIDLAPHPRQDDSHPMPDVAPLARRTGRNRNRQSHQMGSGSSGEAQNPHLGGGASGAQENPLGGTGTSGWDQIPIRSAGASTWGAESSGWGGRSSGWDAGTSGWGAGTSGWGARTSGWDQTPLGGTGSSGWGAGSSGAQQTPIWGTANQGDDDVYRPSMEHIIETHK